MSERGWAGQLLEWGWRGAQLEAEISRCSYFVRPGAHEVIAWGMVRDLAGRYRIEIGSFKSVVEAQRACDGDAQLRCRRAREERGAVDVRIAPGRRRARGRGSAVAVEERDPGGALDSALAAFAGVIEDRD
jgi:hypothetical protein